jgi:hypothetical protein
MVPTSLPCVLHGVSTERAGDADGLAGNRDGASSSAPEVTLNVSDAVYVLPNSGFCGWRTHCSALSNA